MNLSLRCPNPAVCLANRALLMAWRAAWLEIQQCGGGGDRSRRRRSVRRSSPNARSTPAVLTRSTALAMLTRRGTRRRAAGQPPGWRHARTHPPRNEPGTQSARRGKTPEVERNGMEVCHLSMVVHHPSVQV
ncbi:hypothetical protein SORBI_3002G188100 [Sorghum bicolor]|uniref:Uncharacterized protein n=1 Tax=Sorghum bicolor TaxID=4558 RepID=A0A1B6QC91_SORBI|nr:hypothetical protein SORBI_3002G188100 [Sorghum bicolor]